MIIISVIIAEAIALDPYHYWLASLARLRFDTSAKSREKILPPPPTNPGSATGQ